MVGRINATYAVNCDVDATESEISEIVEMIETVLEQEAHLKTMGIDLSKITDLDF